MELIKKTEQFLKETFYNSSYLREHPEELNYRLEHSYRVANIGKQIAEAEGFPVTDTVIACLLHDISYCREMTTKEQWAAHGRTAAKLARPFLQSLGFSAERINDILYGIAIHVDGVSDFPWERTPFAETVGDADNIDRFDAYRIYETLELNGFRKLPLAEKLEQVAATLERLSRLREMKLATESASQLWKQRIEYYISFYEKLRQQLENSTAVI